MIDIDLRELSEGMYGMDNFDDFWSGIKLLQSWGYSDKEINEILEKSKKGKENVYL